MAAEKVGQCLPADPKDEGSVRDIELVGLKALASNKNARVK